MVIQTRERGGTRGEGAKRVISKDLEGAVDRPALGKNQCAYCKGGGHWARESTKKKLKNKITVTEED